MIIISFLFRSWAEYVENGKGLEVERPSRCPRETCNRKDCFWRHTAYHRQVKEGDESVSVRIQRFMCRYCGLVISCLFSFLVPYRQHSARIIAESVETYVTAPATVPLESYRKVAGDRELSRMTLFRWVAMLAVKSKGLHGQVQKEFMLSGRPWQMLSSKPGQSTSPSAGRAKTAEKGERLNDLFRLIEVSKIFIGSVACALDGLHAHFLKNVESRQLILSGCKITHRAQQSMGRVF